VIVIQIECFRYFLLAHVFKPFILSPFFCEGKEFCLLKKVQEEVCLRAFSRVLAPESRSQRSKNEAYDEEEDIVFFRFLDFCDIMKIALAPPTALQKSLLGD